MLGFSSFFFLLLDIAQIIANFLEDFLLFFIFTFPSFLILKWSRKKFN